MSVRRALAGWLPLAVVASALCATLYVVVQQSYRMGANDLPAQLAEDAAAAIGRGTSPAAVVGSGTVDIAMSLSPFLTVFDARGNVTASSARLDGSTPVPPKGIADAALAGGRSAVTWQPRPGVRMATVTVAVPGSASAVMAGRSLRSAEAHVDQLGLLVLLGWGATLVASLAAVALLGGRGTEARGLVAPGDVRPGA